MDGAKYCTQLRRSRPWWKRSFRFIAKKDLADARRLAEYVRRHHGRPASAVTDWVVAKLADELQSFRQERQAAIASFKADLEAEVAEVRAELMTVTVINALEAFTSARKALDEALARSRATQALLRSRPLRCGRLGVLHPQPMR